MILQNGVIALSAESAILMRRHSREFRYKWVLSPAPVQIARDHHLEGQRIGSSCQTYSDARFDPHNLALVIHDSPDLVEPALKRISSV